MTKKILNTVVAFLLSVSALGAQTGEVTGATLEDLRAMLQQQQKMLEDQQRLIASQAEELAAYRKALQSLTARVDQTSVGTEDLAPAESSETTELRERLAALEAEVKDRPEELENLSLAGEFPGSIKIPGTNMAGKVGGYVRLGVVDSLDPIGSADRFIVGSIVVGVPEPEGEENKGVTISAKRSRLNLDMRMDSTVGQFRAFLEGDFATQVDNQDVYRLRHAFGQYKSFIMGQTWSTFMDLGAKPEELDFEGLNSYINDRRPLLRWSSSREGKPSFAIGIEDPATDITGGTGSGDLPDLVTRLATNRDWGHFQVALVLRQLSGQPTEEPGVADTTFGWGVSLSGSNRFPFWSKRDNLKYQLNVGRGIGKYVNDLDSVGGLDAVFDPEGNLRALPAFAGYVAYQHFWKREPLAIFGAKDLLRDLRSTVVYGFTRVDNFDFQTPDAYHLTRRSTLNLIWSPIKAIDLGFELLWGERLNFDKNRGRARQFQMVASFYF